MNYTISFKLLWGGEIIICLILTWMATGGMIEENEFGYGTNMLLDATKTLLTDVLSVEKDSFQYTYDLGDGWMDP